MQKEAPYAIAIEGRYPEQIAIAVARDPKGNYNPITIGWVMPTSIHPPMLALSIGGDRWTAEAIRRAREFVLAYPSETQVEAAKYFGTHSGRDSKKFATVHCETERAHKVDSLILSDAVANFECRLVTELKTGDHVIFVGEVLCSHTNTNPANRLFTLIRSQHMGGFRQK